ncbi:MAG: hypothetical protein IPJ30_08280 [Acidobacteria bacterium]|nr:hypothetical protein [Acidobacteriota bacterium]
MDSENVISLSTVLMTELKNFYNRGFGWICRECESAKSGESSTRSRLMREGEAENKIPVLASSLMARWTNAERTVLECPRCGVLEKVEQR